MTTIPFPPQHLYIIESISRAAHELGYPAYIIGGYVRDLLLNRSCKDIDIVCLGSGIALATLAATLIPDAGQVSVFKNFGTAMFKVADIDLEFVGARKESYHHNSRKPVVEDGTLEDDQNRRDFTINALAISINQANFGTFIDPFGGLKDLDKGLIKTPLSNPDITFSDDPLRMMRAIRFANQLNFTIDPHTLESIGRNCGRLSIISYERITDELNKIMMCPVPSIGFKLLFSTGLLNVFFPELAAMQGVEIVDGIGHKDNFYHTLQVLDNLCAVSNNLWLRWAALLHDIGKPVTKRFEPGEGWTFHGHEAVGAAMTRHIFKRLKLPLNEHLRYVAKMVALHQRPISLTKGDITDSALRRLLYDAGEDIEELMSLCRADITSKNEEKVQRYLENYDVLLVKLLEVEAKDHLRYWQPPIDGQIIMDTFALKPGPQVGSIKTAIREAILDGIIPNSFDEAYQFMLQTAANMGLQPIEPQN